MTPLFLALSILVMMTEPSFANNPIQKWLEEAVKEIQAAGNAGDTSAAERRLRAILEENPNHLEAQWLQVDLKLSKLKNRELTQRRTVLFHAGEVINKIIALAKEQGELAFAHFVTAKNAEFHKAYDRALWEIQQAVTLEPTSTRYLDTMGRIFIDKGKWERDDSMVKEGLNILKQAHQESKRFPSIFHNEGDFHFAVAWGISKLSQPPLDQVITHYLEAIRHGPEKITTRAFAWNNVSIAYRKLGQCEQAQKAAEHALEIFEFGAARNNKQYAIFCNEMQRLGIMSVGP